MRGNHMIAHNSRLLEKKEWIDLEIKSVATQL